MILAFTLGLVLGGILTSIAIYLFIRECDSEISKLNEDIHECERKTMEINKDVKESIKKYLHEGGQ